MNTNHDFTINIIIDWYQNKTSERVKKYNKLYEAIKGCILNNALPNGWVLPSTRVLSESIGVSRSTVIKAYDFLTLENLIKPKVGSGYTVIFELNSSNKKSVTTKINQHFNYPEISESAKHYVSNLSLINREKKPNFTFRPGVPPLDIFPLGQWKKLINLYWSSIKLSELTYSESSGIKELKESICTYLQVSRGVVCSTEQVFIVSGSLQSLFLIGNVLINKNDSVILENPTFPNVYSIFKNLQAKIISADLDEQGIDVLSLRKKEKRLKLIHVTPSNHYPLGVKMTIKRRQDLLKYAADNASYIIENDYENEIANHRIKTPTLFSLDQEGRTIYLGTFNRLLHPSIRLGFMIAPNSLIPALKAFQEISHRFVSPSLQVVMNMFIEKKYMYMHVKTAIETAVERQKIFAEEIIKSNANVILVNNHYESFHTLLVFDETKTEEYENKVISKLNGKGINSLALSKCYIGSFKKYGLIIGHASVSPNLLKTKIRQLGTILSEKEI